MTDHAYKVAITKSYSFTIAIKLIRQKSLRYVFDNNSVDEYNRELTKASFYIVKVIIPSEIVFMNLNNTFICRQLESARRKFN